MYLLFWKGNGWVLGAKECINFISQSSLATWSLWRSQISCESRNERGRNRTGGLDLLEELTWPPVLGQKFYLDAIAPSGPASQPMLLNNARH